MATLAEMDATELRAVMTANRWSVRTLAARLGVPFRTVQRWRDGSSRVPPYLALALETLERRGTLTPARTLAETPTNQERALEPIHEEVEVERVPLED